MARRQAPGTKQRMLVVAARLCGRHGVRSVGIQQLVDETLLKHQPRSAESKLRRVIQLHMHPLEVAWARNTANHCGTRRTTVATTAGAVSRLRSARQFLRFALCRRAEDQWYCSAALLEVST